MVLHISEDNREFFNNFLNSELNAKLDCFEKNVIELIWQHQGLISKGIIKKRFIIQPVEKFEAKDKEALITKLNKMLQNLEIEIRKSINEKIGKSDKLIKKPDSPRLAEDWKSIVNYLPAVISDLKDKIFDKLKVDWSIDDIKQYAEKQSIDLSLYTVIGKIESTNIATELLKITKDYAKTDSGLHKLEFIIELYRECFTSQLQYNDDLTDSQKKLELANFNAAANQVVSIFRLELDSAASKPASARVL